jgi:hypothetical protein
VRKIYKKVVPDALGVPLMSPVEAFTDKEMECCFGVFIWG